MQHEKWCLLLLEGTITADICGMLASKQIIVSCKFQIYMHVLMYILYAFPGRKVTCQDNFFKRQQVKGCPKSQKKKFNVTIFRSTC